MKNWKTKVLALLMVTVLIFGVTACGNKTETSKEDTTTAAKEDDGTKSDESSSEVTEEIVEREHVIIKAFFRKAGPKEGTHVLNYIEEKFNVSFEWEGEGSDKDKLNLMLAAGDYPDIILAQRDEVYESYTAAEALVNIADHYDKIPNLKSAIEKYLPFYENENGEMFSIPYKYDQVAGFDNGFMVRLDVWEDVGAPKIETLDDLTEMVRAMKEMYPEVNGKKAYPFGFFFGDTWGDEWFSKVMVAAQGQTQQKKYNFAWDGNRLSVVNHMFLTDEYRDGLKWANQMYREGLADPESVVMKYNEYKEKEKDGRQFIGITKWEAKEIETALSPTIPEVKVAPMFVDVTNGSYTGGTFHANKWGAGSSEGVWITTQASEAVVNRVLEICDFFATEEGKIIPWWGIEGESYEVLADGTIDFLETIKAQQADGVNIMDDVVGYGGALQYFGTPSDRMASGQPLEFGLDYAYLAKNYNEYEQHYIELLGVEYFEQPFIDSYNGGENTALNAATNLKGDSDLTSIMTQAADLSNQATAELFIAESEEEFDALYDEYVERFKAIGIDKLTKYISDELEAIQDRMGL